MFKYIFYPLMTWIREAVFDMDTCGALLSKIQGKSLSRLDATFMVTVPKNSSILYIMSEQKHTLIISIKPNSQICKPNLAKILPHSKVLLPLVKPQYPNYWGSANPQTIELYLCRSSDKCALLLLPPICSWWQWLCSPCGCKRQAAS